MTTQKPRLIVGLGNPGSKYRNTRHNIGRQVVEFLENPSIHLPPNIILLKPDTFMNESGKDVSRLVHKKNIHPNELLIVLDDFELPLGVPRFRMGGSAGGHNGLKSIIEALNTSDIPRFRIGIGPVPPEKDPADFVLERFSSKELAAIENYVVKAANAVVRAINMGVENAMNEYNNRTL